MKKKLVLATVVLIAAVTCVVMVGKGIQGVNKSMIEVESVNNIVSGERYVNNNDVNSMQPILNAACYYMRDDNSCDFSNDTNYWTYIAYVSSICGGHTDENNISLDGQYFVLDKQYVDMIKQTIQHDELSENSIPKDLRDKIYFDHNSNKYFVMAGDVGECYVDVVKTTEKDGKYTVTANLVDPANGNEVAGVFRFELIRNTPDNKSDFKFSIASMKEIDVDNN